MSSSGRAGDATVYRVGNKGDLWVPRTLLEQVGLDAKMRVRFRVEGKTLVIEKAPGGDNPLDGDLSRNLDQDLFGKIAAEQEERKRRQLEAFGGKVKDAADDPEPPDSIFGRD